MMKRSLSPAKAEQLLTVFYVLFIFFWLFALGSKLYDFDEFRIALFSQVFPPFIGRILLYLLPSIELLIACLLVYSTTRMAGLILSFSMMSMYSIYVLLAVLNLYTRIPCNCAGLLGRGSSWGANLLLNLFITVTAATVLIFTLKYQERRTAVWMR